MPNGSTAHVPVADFTDAVGHLQQVIGALGERIASGATNGIVTIRHREIALPRPGPYVQGLCQIVLSRVDPREHGEILLRFMQSLLETYQDLPPVPPDA